MAVQQGAATFNGSGLQTQIVGQIWRNVTSATFKGAGFFDDFRVSDRYNYDPNSPLQRVMQLRKARFSQEGSFGDD